MHFWKELHQFLQAYMAEKNNSYSNLFKISKSLKYNVNGIIQRTSKKQNKTIRVKQRQEAHGRTKTLSSVL